MQKVSDEEVIAALLKDAKKFKTRWELRPQPGESARVKPNVGFLKRHVSNMVRTNEGRAKQAPPPEAAPAGSGAPRRRSRSRSGTDGSGGSRRASAERGWRASAERRPREREERGRAKRSRRDRRRPGRRSRRGSARSSSSAS